MRMKHYIGIDCGLDGGIVTLDSAGNIIDQRVMPVVAIGKGRKIDLRALSDFFSKWAIRQMAQSNGKVITEGEGYVIREGMESVTVIIENPGKHAPSASGLWSMTYSFAVTEALCVAHGLRYHEVMAQKWQKEFWSKPKMPAGVKFNTKAAALAEARKLWPGNEWRQISDKTGKLLKNPADGVVDAALLATYGMRKHI